MERLRIEFQNRGYFLVEVKNLDIRLSIRSRAESLLCWSSTQTKVGSFKTRTIALIGNHVFTAQLRDAFPIKTGQWFLAETILAKGLERLGHLYATSGHGLLLIAPILKLHSATRSI